MHIARNNCKNSVDFYNKEIIGRQIIDELVGFVS